MKRHRPANAALSLPALLSAALLSLLALSGCVAPPATLYGSQPSYQAPAYQAPSYQPTAQSSQPYETQQYQQQQAPQQTYAPQYSASFCAAGAYQCPVQPGTPIGTSCACSGIGAPSYGVTQ